MTAALANDTAYQRHPISGTFEIADRQRLASMADDIRVNGLRHDIVLYEGMILDGWCRYNACLRAKVEPRFREFGSLETDGDDPFLFAWSENGERRHSQDGQLVLAAQRLTNLREKLARKLRLGKIQRQLPVVSEDAQAVAQTKERGVPELVEAVERGDYSAHEAAQVAKLDEDEQRKVLAKAKEPTKPKRAKQEDNGMRSVVVELTPVDVAALKSMLHVAERSVHAEVRAGAEVVRRVVPWV